jgi:hypothetical protein
MMGQLKVPIPCCDNLIYSYERLFMKKENLKQFFIKDHQHFLIGIWLWSPVNASYDYIDIMETFL